jgi:hypothetical protein
MSTQVINQPIIQEIKMNKSNTRPLQAWEINAEWDCLCGVCGVDLEAQCSGACDGKERKCVCSECGDKDEDFDVEDDEYYYCEKHEQPKYNKDGLKCSACIESEDEEEDFDVDDVDAPNCLPYKKCSVCEERKSCGNYNDNKIWFCEDCFVE